MLDQFSGNVIHYKVWKLTVAFNGFRTFRTDMSIRACITLNPFVLHTEPISKIKLVLWL